ncbi:MAG TPA: hypothetical protein VN700_07890 [Vicinamibacterales bacterium]|nr:hypothetical protein [Vicinamibacterales bacterium]
MTVARASSASAGAAAKSAARERPQLRQNLFVSGLAVPQDPQNIGT